MVCLCVYYGWLVAPTCYRSAAVVDIVRVVVLVRVVRVVVVVKANSLRSVKKN
jgi:hypothetical protein